MSLVEAACSNQSINQSHFQSMNHLEQPLQYPAFLDEEESERMAGRARSGAQAKRAGIGIGIRIYAGAVFKEDLQA